MRNLMCKRLAGSLLCVAALLMVFGQTSVFAKQGAVKVSPDQALQMLIEGNKRFVAGKALAPDLSKERRAELAQKGQFPFAVVLSCADSRVPPEHVFGQGLGDLFVLRVAGNVLVPVITGSIEFSQTFDAPLIVVMGHDKCGAVEATVDNAKVSDNITAIAQQIVPALKAVKEGKSAFVNQDIYEAVTSENVAQVVAELKKNPELKPNVDSGKLKIVGAKYYLASGQVEFFQ